MYSFYNKEENKNLKVLEGSFVCLKTKLIFKWDKKNSMAVNCPRTDWACTVMPCLARLLGAVGEACLSTL